MPEYMYRREDGSTFTIRQKFFDDPLTVDPDTGQTVVRVIQPTGIIFKGSGFYVNDSKSASKTSLPSKSNDNGNHSDAGEAKTSSSESKSSSKESSSASTTDSSSSSSSTPAASSKPKSNSD